VAQLERLDALHASGSISDQQFESLKQRLIDAPG
jgi:Short C-terminal domain